MVLLLSLFLNVCIYSLTMDILSTAYRSSSQANFRKKFTVSQADIEKFKTIWDFKNSDCSFNPGQDQVHNSSSIYFLQIDWQLTIPTFYRNLSIYFPRFIILPTKKTNTKLPIKQSYTALDLLAAELDSKSHTIQQKLLICWRDWQKQIIWSSDPLKQDTTLQYTSNYDIKFLLSHFASLTTCYSICISHCHYFQNNFRTWFWGTQVHIYAIRLLAINLKQYN